MISVPPWLVCPGSEYGDHLHLLDLFPEGGLGALEVLYGRHRLLASITRLTTEARTKSTNLRVLRASVVECGWRDRFPPAPACDAAPLSVGDAQRHTER